MKPFAGYEANEKAGNSYQQLPAGAYIAKVLAAEEKTSQYGEFIELKLDITEGDYKNYYQNRFDGDATSQFGQRWKGTFRIYAPMPGDQKGKISFNSAMGAFEKSNPGFKWNWITPSLVGKAIGIIVGNVECDYGWFTKIRGLCSTKKVQDGSYYHYPDKPMKKNEESSLPSDVSLPSGFKDVSNGEELPF